MGALIEPVPGLTFDVEARLVHLCGTALPVGNLYHSPYQRGGDIITEDEFPADWLPLMRDLGMIGRVRTELPESIHFTVLCGENGWWIEMAVYPADGGLNASLPTELNPLDDITAEEAHALWVETCRRTDAPPPSENESDEAFPGPFGGAKPGSWSWFTDARKAGV